MYPSFAKCKNKNGHGHFSVCEKTVVERSHTCTESKKERDRERQASNKYWCLYLYYTKLLSFVFIAFTNDIVHIDWMCCYSVPVKFINARIGKMVYDVIINVLCVGERETIDIRQPCTVIECAIQCVLTIDKQQAATRAASTWEPEKVNPMKIVRWAWNKTSENIASFASTVLCKQCIIRFSERIEWTQLTNNKQWTGHLIGRGCVWIVYVEFSMKFSLLRWFARFSLHHSLSVQRYATIAFVYVHFVRVCFESRLWMIIFLYEVFFFLIQCGLC